MKMNRKKPLYRKRNWRVFFGHKKDDGDAKYSRHTKKGMRRSMKGKNWGRDYTPLLKFLLSKVGQPFDKVHSEAVSRLDKEEPIWYMVKKEKKGNGYFRYGESGLWSSLYVDEDGILQKIKPDLTIKDLNIHWDAVWHETLTFNGKVIKQNKSNEKG